MSTSNTDRAEYLFRVEEFADGTPWIYCQLVQGPDLPAMKNGYLGFEVKPGTTYGQAREIAKYMNDHLGKVFHTTISH